MSKLLSYLNLIDEDSAMREAHLVDPSKAMAQYGLGTVEQQALASGNKNVVANVVANLAGADADEERVIVFVASATGQRSSCAGRAWRAAIA